MNKISIIIPVYNSEKYLSRCLDSVLGQSYRNIEIILIDDGSTDSSFNICQDYSNKNENIVFISKENEGPGATRNKALALLSGDYIGFVDSDDFIDKEMYSEMVKEAERTESDLVQCGYYKADESGKVLGEKNFSTEVEVIRGSYNCSFEYEKRRKINNFLCTKLFSRKVFNEVIIPSFFYAEDQCALTQVFYKCEKIAILPKAYYYYVTNYEGLYHSDFNIKQLDSIKAGKFMYDYHKDRHMNLSKFSSLRICYYIIKFYGPLERMNIKNKQEILKEMKKDFRLHYSNFINDIPMEYASRKRRSMIKLAGINLRLTSHIFYLQRKLFNKY